MFFKGIGDHRNRSFFSRKKYSQPPPAVSGTITTRISSSQNRTAAQQRTYTNSSPPRYIHPISRRQGETTSSMEVASENFESLSYRELQALAKARSVKANGKKEQLIRRLTEVRHSTQQQWILLCVDDNSNNSSTVAQQYKFASSRRP